MSFRSLKFLQLFWSAKKLSWQPVRWNFEVNNGYGTLIVQIFQNIKPKHMFDVCYKSCSKCFSYN